MLSITEALEKFNQLTDALRQTIDAYLDPYTRVLPDARHRRALRQLVPGLLAARSPHLSKAAAHAPADTSRAWARTKRFYTLMHTDRFSHQDWLQVLYAQAVDQVNTLAPNRRLLVAIDPLNLEKAYARQIEGVCQVLKKTPPGWPPNSKPQGKNQGRLTWGYPSIAALALNTPQPALLHQRLFSYVTDDFISQPWEWMVTMRQLRQLLPQRKITIVADAEADDQKLWQEARANDLELIVRATSRRNIEVYQPRQRCWQEQELQAWSESLPGRTKGIHTFTHAGGTIPVRVTLDWFRFRLPDSTDSGWAVVAYTEPIGPQSPEDFWLLSTTLVLVSINRPVRRGRDAWKVYRDWAQRGKIETFYRFLQEDGLDSELILLHQLERFRRLLLVVLMAVFFVIELEQLWAPVLIQWVRSVVSSVVGTTRDRGGRYLLLGGLQRILDTAALLELIRIRSPPVRYLPQLS
jgi:hypothetical protein